MLCHMFFDKKKLLLQFEEWVLRCFFIDIITWTIMNKFSNLTDICCFLEEPGTESNFEHALSVGM